MSNSVLHLSNEQQLEVLSLSKNATAIYTTDDIIIQNANDAMIAFWGKDRSVIGKPLEEAIPELKGQPFKEMLQSVWRTGETFSGTIPAKLMIDGKLQTSYFEYEYKAIKNAAGETYCILHTANDVTDHLLSQKAIKEGRLRELVLNQKLAISNDELFDKNKELTVAIEELNESQETLNKINLNLVESEEQLQFAINAANLATWDLDPVTNRFSGNDRLKSWFGISHEAEIDLSKATEVISEDDRARVLAAIDSALNYNSGGNYDIEYTILNTTDMVPRVVKAKGRALFNIQRQPIRFSGTLQDITEQKKDEQRKNDFIGMVSHELKTPLTSLKAYVQLLHAKARKQEDSFTTNALSIVETQINKMTTMINGFLNISRLESGKIYLNKQEFAIDQLINGVIDDTRLIASKHSIILHHEPTMVNADYDKIEHVVSNFLSNAIKYSQSETTIEINCGIIDGMAQVSIKDKGIGIKPDDIDKLFERYYRAKNEQMQTVSGFGIGLYLSAEIVQRHNGKIWVESEIDKGSTFYFSLPLNIQ